MLVAAILAAVCAGGIEAQEDQKNQENQENQENTSPLPRHGCFRGKPLPECQGFWIYELRGSLPLVNTTRVHRTEYADTAQRFGPGEFPIREFGQAAALEVGYAWNLNEATAVGGTTCSTRASSAYATTS